MLDFILFHSLGWLKDFLQPVVEPVSNTVGEVFVLDNEDLISDFNSFLRNKSDGKWFATWNLEIQEYPAKSSIVRQPYIDQLVGVQYKTIPITLVITGSFLSNSPVSIVKLYETIYLYHDASYHEAVPILVEDKQVELPFNYRISTTSAIHSYKNSALPSFDYEFKVDSLLLTKIQEGKLIQTPLLIKEVI